MLEFHTFNWNNESHEKLVSENGVLDVLFYTDDDSSVKKGSISLDEGFPINYTVNYQYLNEEFSLDAQGVYFTPVLVRGSDEEYQEV